MSSVTGKLALVLFETAVESYKEQNQMLDLVNFTTPDPASMQNQDNVVWKSRQQRANIKTGWDMTGQADGIIKETYPCRLGEPSNDVVEQRADDVRDQQFWVERGRESGKQQVMELNKAISNAMIQQGGMFVEDNSASGYDFISKAAALKDERQLAGSDWCFLLNDRDRLKYAQDLAGRQTVQGRPEMAWKTGSIGKDVAGFDVYSGSFLSNVVGAASPDTTVTGDQSFKPEGGAVSATGIVTNVDYRLATIPVADSSGYAVGDKVQFINGADPVMALGVGDYTNTLQPMTFPIVGIPSATSIQIFIKPIAFDDPALTSLEERYANIDKPIGDGAIVRRVNTTSAKANLFWEKNAVEVTGGTIPAGLFSQFGGNQVESDTMPNGQKMYMLYDGDIMRGTFSYRLFTWWGITVSNPMSVGVALSV